MANTRPFRVVIGGGGIAGLTLANALEKAGIDYLLLESRNSISPQVGASIGFLPNGGRIMDQLGCFDQLESTTVPLKEFYNRYANGKIISVTDVMELSARRYVLHLFLTSRTLRLDSY
jgi:2-polyprenyl-6-methoxyphenol hydroxylase-like FAD-dependent oxidoreductase